MGLAEFFCRYKRFSELTNMFYLETEDYSISLQGFHDTEILLKRLSSVIKALRKPKSLSNLSFCMYCLKSRFFVLILAFMVSFIHTGSLSSIFMYLLGTYFLKTFKIVSLNDVTCALISLPWKSLSQSTESRTFLILICNIFLATWCNLNASGLWRT